MCTVKDSMLTTFFAHVAMELASTLETKSSKQIPEKPFLPNSCARNSTIYDNLKFVQQF